VAACGHDDIMTPTRREVALDARRVGCAGNREAAAGLLVEHVVWRGCRHNSARIPMTTAYGFLHAGLQTEGIRGVHHCCVAAMPLTIPLPFPRMYRTGLTSEGDWVCSTMMGARCSVL
jgi:hypothetical protein